jgi:MerR family mercuric resistance operon transcriptional regulator/MerR family gold-responsive transcriptional activator of gol and ges genes
MASGLTIGQLAKEVGVNIETVRYYERLNMLQPLARKPSGYRMYGNEETRRLRFIKNAQALGFTLREIAELLNLRVSSKSQCGDVRQKAQAKLAQVEAKVNSLEALARALKDLIRDCRAGQHTNRCPILKSLEEERRTNNGNRKTKG